MKIKTSELEGAALDWAVAQTMPEYMEGFDVHKNLGIIGEHWAPPFSTSWSHGGPLIDELVTVLVDSNLGGEWHAECSTNMHGRPLDEFDGKGPTALIAAMRAIVASELGDEVDVPEELL